MSLVINKQAEAKREASKEKSLHDWFSRKGGKGSKGGWVDCNAPDGSGGYKTCGRSSGEERGEYPACRPTPGACKEKGRGDSWGKKSEEDKKKDDACTSKVKAIYDVWPSAYASGALTKCRQVGAANWGNKSKKTEKRSYGYQDDLSHMDRLGFGSNEDLIAKINKLKAQAAKYNLALKLSPYRYHTDENGNPTEYDAEQALKALTEEQDNLPGFYSLEANDKNKSIDWAKVLSDKAASASSLTAKLLKLAESAAWQRSEGKNPEGGLNRTGIKSYREANPGSKLQMAVTTDPSKLDPDSKPAKRRKSFCARMGGMPGPMQDEKGRPTRKALALRKWNC